MGQGNKQNGGETWEKTLGGIGFCCIQPRARTEVNRIREVPLGYHDNMILDTLSMPRQSLSPVWVLSEVSDIKSMYSWPKDDGELEESKISIEYSDVLFTLKARDSHIAATLQWDGS